MYPPMLIPRIEADTIKISEVNVRSQAFDGPRTLYYTVVDQMVGMRLGDEWLV